MNKKNTHTYNANTHTKQAYIKTKQNQTKQKLWIPIAKKSSVKNVATIESHINQFIFC